MRGGADAGRVDEAFRVNSFGERDQLGLGALEELFATPVVTNPTRG